MSKAQFLGGKVSKRSLPVLTPPLPPGGPVCKRLALPQGELAQFHDSADGFRYAAIVELRPGTVRGNHYHLHKEETVYLVSGAMTLAVEDVQTGQRELIPLVAGDLVRLSPGIAHCLQPTAPGYAIEVSPSRFDPADSFPRQLIPQ